MFLIDVELFTEENEGLELQASSFTNDGLFMIGVVTDNMILFLHEETGKKQ